MGQKRKGDTLGIGEFALLTAISIPALRHYHEVGLLVPCGVDRWTGYRRYRLGQARVARIIRTLRALEMPLDEVAPLLEALEVDWPTTRSALVTHRQRLTDRVSRTTEMIQATDKLIEGEDLMKGEIGPPRVVEVVLNVSDLEASRAFYHDVIGMEFEAEAHDGVPLHYHGLTSRLPGNFFLFTLMPCSTTEHYRSIVGFVVEDVDEVHRRAQRAGATILCEPTDSDYMPRYAAFADPAGNRVTVYKA